MAREQRREQSDKQRGRERERERKRGSVETLKIDQNEIPLAQLCSVFLPLLYPSLLPLHSFRFHFLIIQNIILFYRFVCKVNNQSGISHVQIETKKPKYTCLCESLCACPCVCVKGSSTAAAAATGTAAATTTTAIYDDSEASATPIRTLSPHSTVSGGHKFSSENF